MLTLFSFLLQTGTTLMIALPLGTVLCFFDLLGARAFSRGEVSLASIITYPTGLTIGRFVAGVAIHFS